MSTLLLKAAAANIKSDNSDLTIGRTHSQTKMAPLLVKSKPGIFYRLVDEKTGQIVKTQTLMRKGKNLQVLVDQKLVLELEDFFAHPTDPQTSLASLPGYLVDNLNIFQGKADVTETTEVNFTDGLRVGESATVGGLTITATSDMSASNVANAFASLANGASSTNLTPSTTFTYSGSLTGWSSGTLSQAVTGSNWLVTFTSTTTNTDVADLTASYKLRDNDTFKWVSGDAGTTGATDIIKDFTAWSNNSGDKLDILGLLTGYNSATSILANWVTVALNQTAPSTSTANSTKITIDIDGTAGTGTTVQTIWLEGVTLNSTNADTLKTNGVLIA